MYPIFAPWCLMFYAFVCIRRDLNFGNRFKQNTNNYEQCMVNSYTTKHSNFVEPCCVLNMAYVFLCSSCASCDSCYMQFCLFHMCVAYSWVWFSICIFEIHWVTNANYKHIFWKKMIRHFRMRQTNCWTTLTFNIYFQMGTEIDVQQSSTIYGWIVYENKRMCVNICCFQMFSCLRVCHDFQVFHVICRGVDVICVPRFWICF